MTRKALSENTAAAHMLGYQCSLCRTSYGLDEVSYTCPRDGGNLDLVLDFDQLKRQLSGSEWIDRAEPSIWRYAALLPVSACHGPASPLGRVGWTPVYQPDRLSEALNLEKLWVKDEGCNPTASFKDRASAVVIRRSIDIDAEVVATASTGNAGAALAGMAAAVGRKAVIFAPKTAPPAKVAQLLVYGARVLLVDGSYDDAFDLSVKACREFGWYCRNTGYNPFTVEGKKTVAFEIWETLIAGGPAGDGRLNIFVSVGDGNIISGLHKGFKDLVALGLLERSPRLIGVQAEGSAAIAGAFEARSESIQPVRAQTLADSISVDMPRDGLRGLRAATETGGAYLTVSDRDILRAIASLGRVGIFAEPAGATAYAGLSAALARGLVEPDAPVLVLNTGSGLKDVKAAQQAVAAAPVITCDLESVSRALRSA